MINQELIFSLLLIAVKMGVGSFLGFKGTVRLLGDGSLVHETLGLSRGIDSAGIVELLIPQKERPPFLVVKTD